MGSVSNEVVIELTPFIRVYKDGYVERLAGSPIVPPSPEQDPDTGVSSKDVIISLNPPISARLYLPNNLPNKKLPILVYFHGGAFCIESAFSFLDHRYLNNMVSEAQVVGVSVEYRLAPEHPLPTAYQDCWDALQWVASHSIKDKLHNDPWLADFGDFSGLFIGGDSAGANIAHNVAMRAGNEGLSGGVKIEGTWLAQPFFWASSAIGVEPEKRLPAKVWNVVWPSAPGGVDNPMINPVGEGCRKELAGLGCSRLLVCVAEKDTFRERGVLYCDAVKESGWEGEVEFFEVKGEDHGFHIFHPYTVNSKAMIKRLASFLSGN
ncbi:2-hydroxyisoflavanone dehydratase-like [Carica papaya]|uniref:2-hydroxyisoflavanone dehydratase-like n=1 Tax=Carica papaya TaxID=3649 RepID=UPI000B8C9FB3|nr:2-hydroxyisoflavanone dehydratase-like [Carica papaya]